MAKLLSNIGIYTFFSVALKLLYVRDSIMEEIGIAGYLTEISFLAIFIMLVSFLKHSISVPLFFLFNMTISFLSLAAIMYFDYYHTIFTYKALAELDQIVTIKDSVFALLEIEYLFLFVDFVLAGFMFSIGKRISVRHIPLPNKSPLLIALIASFLIALGVRNVSGMISEINKYETLGLVGYQLVEGGADLARSWNGGQSISAETIQQYKQIDTGNRKYEGIAAGKNIIIVQLESVQNFVINKKIDGQPVTPNLNALLKEAFYFPNTYTQVGKGNTSDAEFITNTSIYALGDTAMSAAAQGKDIPGLPRELIGEGYHTATFHANGVSFWNRKEMYRSLGFNEYYDKKYFGNEDVISYGASDEVFYEKLIDQLSRYKQQGKKFYAHAIALSSHFPYKLPEEKKKLAVDLPDRFDGSSVGDYLEAVSYADFAFGRFIDGLKREGLYEDSVIVVYGDHQGLQTKTDTDKQLVREVLGRQYHPVLDHLNVLLFMKIPSITEGKVIQMTGGLVDIYPTIANILGLDIRDEVVFGTDLLNTSHNLIGIRFYAPTGTYINEQFSFSPGKMKNSGKITNLHNRKESTANAASLKDLEEMIKYLEMSDEYVGSLKPRSEKR
ncbi:LTA synthase family protein [Peribacillus glennii]|uniref:LTA synthase family protein n=1 Tax=Peribacillus glennii TaxID=2303991 RepID=A0A372LF83_9BACI|nr:LTA synthase family protein [Peribacillus glennii]RFU63970.1 LTA synthase family protein [Peribacillus glennii]